MSYIVYRQHQFLCRNFKAPIIHSLFVSSLLKSQFFQLLEKEKKAKLVSLSTLIMTITLERYMLVSSRQKTFLKQICLENLILMLSWLMGTRNSKLTQQKILRILSLTMKQTLMSLTMETTKSKLMSQTQTDLEKTNPWAQPFLMQMKS